MNQKISTLFLLSALPFASLGQRGILLGIPHDDPSARRDIYRLVEIKPFAAEYDQVIKTRIWPLKREGIVKVFGPKIERRRLIAQGDPTNSVAPLFAPYSISFSGLLDGQDRSHRDLYAVGDIGYVEFFFERDDSFKTAVLYARLDDKFVPLESANQFSKRLEWDKSKFDGIKKWLDSHALPVGDATKVNPNEGTKPAK
jgi:hypothetical protein